MPLRNKREFEFPSLYLPLDVPSPRDLGSSEHNVNVFYSEDMSIEEPSMANAMRSAAKNHTQTECTRTE